jgi:hypothetical protein
MLHLQPLSAVRNFRLKLLSDSPHLCHVGERLHARPLLFVVRELARFGRSLRLCRGLRLRNCRSA